ncbi:uncharacterized protein LOC135080155 [Ostrinia nubilalis]|uniref:uncharacterized protein LOC135080155 n=1 Tax=Ostrinia nubilalis TaxID=29057 RepID=UPI0030822778
MFTISLSEFAKFWSDIEYYNKIEAKPRAARKREDLEDDERPIQRPRKASKAVFYDSEDEHASKRTKTLKKPPPSKRKSAAGLEKDLFDSEDEQVHKRVGKETKRPAALKRKRARADGWELELDDEEDVEASRARAAPGRLQSVLTRRVADGNLRSTASLPGDLFVELRLYNAKDIRSVAPKDRWEKSVLALKYQTDSDAEEVNLLRQFIKRARAEFVEEGTFFPNRK